MTTNETKPTIHILGGGPSGLSAAFHLTSPEFNPDWRDRYRVVVHQLGWRLGGKGATGRNAEMGERIEEHGIHLFGNMY
ncbi:MAG: NAD(P)-binding protein, partial [Actinomycetota bacterium]